MSTCCDTFQISNGGDAILFPMEQALSFPWTTSLARPSRLLIPVQLIEGGGRLFALKAPILIELCVEDGSWVCEYKPFSVISFGASPERAVYSFFEDFAVVWDEIAEARDETLAADALKVKQALRLAVKDVR
jgi:hypothetical protein